MIDASSPFDIEHAKRARTPIYQVSLTPPSTPAQLLPTPVAYWKLEEPSGTRMDSLGSNHLTDNNTVTQAAGKQAYAAQFTAANSEYLSIADNTDLSVGNIDFTVAFWVYLDDIGSTHDFINRYNIAGQRSYDIYFTTGAGFNFAVSDNGVSNPTVLVTAATFGAPAAGVWYCVICWHDAANNIVGISVNGIQDTAAHTTGAFDGTSEFQIGGINGSGAPHNGRIDEVGFWKVVLSAQERADFYNGGLGITLDTLLGMPAGLTYNCCTASPMGGANIGEKILVPVELVRRVEVEKCRFSLSTCTFLLQDIDSVATGIISAGIVGYRCAFYVGYFGLEWSASPVNYVQLFGGIITEIEYRSGSYRITARSPMAAAQDKIIFSGAASRLTSGINSTDVTLNVVDATGFEAADSSPQALVRNVVIDDEIMAYRSKSSTTLATVLRPGATGFFVPPAAGPSVSHSAGALVKELVKHGSLTVTNANYGSDDLHPIELFILVMTVSEKKGIGEAGVEMNDDELDAVKAAIGVNIQYRFSFAEGENAKRFLEEQFYLTLAAYPTEDEQGRIGMKLYQGGSDATIVGTITDADIVAPPVWVRNAEKMINTVIIHYDYMPTIKEYTSTFIHRDDDLVEAVGREITLEIFSKGMRSYFLSPLGPQEWFGYTGAFLTDMAERTIARFGGISPLIHVQTLMSKSLFEVGDDVEVSFSQAINVGTSERFLTNARFEIVAMTMNFETNLIDMELLGYPDE